MQPQSIFHIMNPKTVAIPQIPSITQIHVALSNYEKPDMDKPELRLEEKMDRLRRDKKRMNEIMDTVCSVQGVLREDLTSTRYRLQLLCFTRNMIVYFAKKYTKLTLRDIARAMWTGEGKPFHHSTIIHCLKCCREDIYHQTVKDNFWKNYLKVDKMLRSEYES